ncbi:MAG: hypothetical protein AB1941_21110 [Gemmatimonadota bacterium]
MQRANREGRGPLHMRVAGRTLGSALRVVPYERRFAAALAMARTLSPVLHRLLVGARLPRGHTDTPLASALFSVLGHMHRRRIPFPLPVRVEGSAEILAPRDGRGLLVVGPFSALNSPMMRFLHRHRPDMTVVTGNRLRYECIGDEATIPVICRGPAFMVGVRQALARGGLVAAMIERWEPGRRTVGFPTARGPMLAADALVRLAARCDARLCFAAVRLDGDGAVTVALGAPPEGAPRSAEADLAAYVAFVQRLVAASARAG